ncbi:MAG: carboxypeptidase regulatory-like domain-containing protein, partial [Bacteroidota bacterium]
TPTFVSFAPNVYSHDVFVQDSVMYASEIFEGDLTLYDVRDPQNIFEMGVQQTPRTFTHNAWTTATGDVVFTTDERGNASTAAYDISDPQDIQLLDEFRPTRSLGNGSIPHNVHVLNEYLIISHYTDGVEIVDASVPNNLVEVAYYDSWYGGDGGFFGSWGAYPFLPSGLVLSTDINNGLFVVEVDYKRAARLQGQVTDLTTGNALNNVTVTVGAPQVITDGTDALGDYIVGTAASGMFEVTYSLPGYFPEVVTVNFQHGVIQTVNVQLRPKMLTSFSGTVRSSNTNLGIENAPVRIVGEDGTFDATTDANGNVTVNNIFEGDYTVYTGKWGFKDAALDVSVTAGGVAFSMMLDPGFQDGFAVDQGWTVINNAVTGAWERGLPNGTSFNEAISNPNVDADSPTDVGMSAYVTGNLANGSVGDDDVDGGTTTLLSPVFDPASFPGADDLLVRFQYWFFNEGGTGLTDDTLKIFFTNGTDSEVLEAYFSNDQNSNTAISTWVPVSLRMSELTIPLTATMQFGALIGDTGEGHLVEGGIDNFQIEGVESLPVEFLSFTAEALSKTTVALNWATATEENSEFFDVERSRNGLDFHPIGRVAASGTTETTTTYQFTDLEAQTGANHYRLRQVDQDGSITFSNIRLVLLASEANTLTAWPNPAIDQINLSEEMTGTAQVFRADGALVQTQVLVQTQTVNITSLPAGYYLLRIGDRVVNFVKK